MQVGFGKVADTLRMQSAIIPLGTRHFIPFQDEFKINFSETIKTVISEKVSSFETIRTFYEDKARFGLFPVSYRRITLSGIKPIIRGSWTYENFYLYGAVEPITGQSFFLEMPWLNGACFQVFLDEFAKVYPASLNILVLDNSRFHQAKSLQNTRQCGLSFSTTFF